MRDELHFWSSGVEYDAAVTHYSQVRPRVRLLDRIPGKRTFRDLASAAVPARLYLVMAGLAIVTCIAMHIIAAVLARTGPAWLATEAATYASIFRAMPPWFLIGGALSQVAARLNVAIDDARAWWRASKRAG